MNGVDWLTEQQAKNALRDIAESMFPDIPLPDKEQLVSQALELINQYGPLRLATLGEMAQKLIMPNPYLSPTETGSHSPDA